MHAHYCTLLICISALTKKEGCFFVTMKANTGKKLMRANKLAHSDEVGRLFRRKSAGCSG